jgi:hypothetical protein
MAFATIEMRKEFTLQLTQEEAEWLQDLLQNPIREAESEDDKCNRESIFIALSNVTIPR